MPDYIVYLRVDASVVVRAESEDQAKEAVTLLSTGNILDTASFEATYHRVDGTELENKPYHKPIYAQSVIAEAKEYEEEEDDDA